MDYGRRSLFFRDKIMIIDIIFIIIGWVLGFLASFLPTWEVWPQVLLDGINYFFASFASLNVLIPIGTIFSALLFLVQFSAVLYSARILMKIIGFFRGSSNVEV